VDVVHVGNPPDNAWMFASILRLVQGFTPTLVYDQHDPAPLLVREKFGRRKAVRLIENVVTRLEAMNFSRAQLVVFANELFHKRASDLGLLRSGAVVVPNGWRLPAPPRWQPPPWRDPSVPLVTYVGTTNTQDCVGHLVAAMARLRTPAQLVVVGDGEARTGAEMLALDLGIEDRIVWLGWVTDRQLIAQLVGGASVCVAPETSSPVNDITSFVKVAEYMSLGAPVACHRLPQTERIAGNAVEYADGESPAALAAAIERLLLDPALAASRRDGGRRRFDEGLCWESVGAKRLIEGYATTVGGKVEQARVQRGDLRS
jgi:glycosyltransferase involved in cell wall biosynthesis